MAAPASAEGSPTLPSCPAQTPSQCEAVRLRLIVAFAAITVLLVGLGAWGFNSHSSSVTSGEVHAAISQALVLFMLSLVVALSASAIASHRSPPSSSPASY
ncbi:MAG: hypothetical protein M0004_13675 [Actinomycetota bacterium]|nr:hypothetical protein [Actinomycetota bacterium]